jgi:ABC-type amino acid transport substrate-binding protein
MKMAFKLLGFIVFMAFAMGQALAESKHESAYDRIMRTRTLKCGYITAPPYFTIDPNTKKMGGIIYDITEEIGKKLSLKVEWVEEVNTGHMFEGFKSGRYDAICQSIAPLPERSLESDFTTPLFYSGTFIYARTDDTRFKSIADVRKEAVKIAMIEGEYLNHTVHDHFPKAIPVVLPSMTDLAQVLMHVSTKKTDVSIQSPEVVAEFLKHNPGVVKKVTEEPLRVLGGTLAIPKNEFQLKRMLDVTIETLLNTGFIDQTVAKHSDPAFFLKVTRPYQLPQ